MAGKAGSDEQLRVALWLQPRPGSPLHTVLRQTIVGLAPVFDDAPVFMPHVTLVTGIHVHNQGEIDLVLDSAFAAAKSVPQLTVRFDKITYGSTFFRKVVFEVLPLAELISLAAIAKEEFVLYPHLKYRLGLQPENKHKSSDELHADAVQQATKEANTWVKEQFRPHLSLVYSDLYPVSESARHTVHQRLQDVFGPGYEQRGLGWQGGQLALVQCEGPVESWRVLGTRNI